jgi:bifunctional UDP-N-acetylglucosamine pyrophosphorylase/glucosamine-1-phosphate N-acetyltransferase
MKSDLPKVVQPILGWPMVRYVVRNLKAVGIRDIIAVVGYRKEDVMKVLGDEVRYVDQGEPKGTGHAVLCCKKALQGYQGPLLVLNGDSPLVGETNIRPLVMGLDKLKADAVMFTACIDDPSGYGRVVRGKDGRVERIVEDADAGMEKTINEINSGAYAFRAPEIFDILSKITPKNAKKEYYLTDAVSIILKKGGRVEAARANNPIEAYGVNTRRDQIVIQNYMRLQIIEKHLENGVAILDPTSVYIEDDVTIGEGTTIEPYTVIRRGVTIGKGCHVGPFAQIRTGTVLADGAEVGNFVEVKNSKIGPKSKAKHLSYLGDATLGANVNIGAGTITANYDGKNKHSAVIEDGASTGSNTVLIAPVKLGKNSKTGAGAVVTSGHDVPEGVTVVGVPAKAIKAKRRSK